MNAADNTSLNSDTSKWKIRGQLLFLCLLFGLAFLIRLARYNDAIFGNRLIFLDADTYYHLRRIHFCAAHYPSLMNFDYYMDFPHGADVVLPPGFDFLVATLALPANGGYYSPLVTNVVAALVPPFFGALLVFSVFFAGRLFFNRSAALWASLSVVIMVSNIWPALFAKPDHHVLECLLTPILAALFSRFTEHIPDSDYTPRIRWHRIWPLILLAVVCQLMWRGAIVFIASFLLFSYLILLFDWWKESRFSLQLSHGFRTRCVELGLLCLGIALGISWWCLTSPFGRRGEFTYYALSLFHPLFYSLMSVPAVLLIILYYVKRYGGQRERYGRFFWLLSIIIVSGCLALLAFLPYSPIFTQIVEGMQYLGKSDTWMSVIEETQPLFGKSLWEGLKRGSLYVGLWFPLMPLLLLMLLRIEKGRKKWFFVGWCLLSTGLTLTQIRYNHQLGVNMALLGGWALAGMQQRLSRRISPKSNSLFFSWGVTAALWILMLSPCLINLEGFLRTRYIRENSVPLQVWETLTWMRDNTPTAGNSNLPQVKPHYGVLSLWDYGNWIVSIARRPTIASNFGFLHQGLITSCQALLTHSPHTLEKLLIKNRIRYLILGDFRTRYPELRAILKSYSFSPLNSNKWAMGKGQGAVSRVHGRGEAMAIPLSYLLFAQRIIDDSNTQASSLKPVMEKLRLVFRSPDDPEKGFSPLDTSLSVYEYVKGATVRFRGRPSTTLKLWLPLRSNRGETLVYRRYCPLNEKGVAQLIVPYSTSDKNGAITALSPYQVTDGRHTIRFQISESSIRRGSIKTISFPALHTDNL